MTDLSNKTAVVTGASSGIGLAICQQLLARQCRVIGIARDFSGVDIDSVQFDTHSIDLTDLQACERQFKQIVRDTPPDYFIHSAGYGLFGSIEQFSVRQINDYLRANLTSALVISRALLPSMRRNKAGRMIFIGSESALSAGRKGALYSTAKFGLRGLTQALREDCARDGISVSLINPGMVRTPFFDELNFRPAAGPENALEADDIARLVLHIIHSSRDMVIDEINLSPRNHSIDFS